MQPLDKQLRNQLERTVKEARDIAETAARAALEQLGVGEPNPFAHLSESEKELRRKLRLHGRQLGDSLNGGKIQTIDRLVEETAYEHWHRMLFARFLAENNLLMYPDPDSPVAVSLEECEDLATEQGAKNGWELASRFAARMLPQIFRPDSPVFQLTLPPEHQQKLERLVSDLPREVFTASDSLGWVYQFWQAKKKDEVNASEVKIGARELPAVTQLFTEPYMVAFLLDNSLGAWWAAQRLTIEDLKNTNTEDELRKKASLPGMPLEYLRFVKCEDGKWTPAAGTFDGWPKNLAELKTLDPCCGSGHFLVAAFLLLVAMRMEMEKLSAKEAVEKVLIENIHGLEIDKRCVELAAFALALTAWRYPDAGGYRPLPELHVACSGLSVSVSKEEWQKLANGNHNLLIAMGILYDEFRNAPTLGSLLNPSKSGAAKLVDWNDMADAVGNALAKEHPDEEKEAGVVAQGLAKAATLLAGKYHFVITNVPYLARGKQNDTMLNYCEKYYPEAKHDLATVFLDRCLEFCVTGGTSSIVLPQNWLFLTSYRKFREKLLKNDTWHLITRLGPKGFSTPMWDFNVQLIILSQGNDTFAGGLFDNIASHMIRGLDVSEPRTTEEKADGLVKAEIKCVEQKKQLENPDVKISLDKMDIKSILCDFASVHYGSKPGQTARVTRQYWEISDLHDKFWMMMESSPSAGKLVSGKTEICYSLNTIKKFQIEAFGVRGSEAWGKAGIIISKMSELPYSIYLGNFFDDNTCTIIPNNISTLSAVFCAMQEGAFCDAVRLINQKISVTKETLEKTPFDLVRWAKVAEGKYPNGLPKPYSDDPTQWIFHGHPAHSDEPLQVAVARLLGYCWPAELDIGMELSEEARDWVKNSEALLPFADEDGIVCIPPVRGEVSAGDRLLNLLAAAYGDSWSNDTLAQLLKNDDHAGKTLDTWLREKFFAQHCKLFQHRPFIWHIWDGLREGFAVLVNYHKLDHKNLETLIYTYLGDWISRQKQDIASGVDGAIEKLAAAMILSKKLELILEGEEPYDIFVRWKPIEKQPIGWEPDINDGVRLNIRPFMTAGVLRENKPPKLNVKWDKDRGKDVESAPWYHLFNGDRINDWHLSLEEKRKARE